MMTYASYFQRCNSLLTNMQKLSCLSTKNRAASASVHEHHARNSDTNLIRFCCSGEIQASVVIHTTTAALEIPRQIHHAVHGSATITSAMHRNSAVPICAVMTSMLTIAQTVYSH